MQRTLCVCVESSVKDDKVLVIAKTGKWSLTSDIDIPGLICKSVSTKISSNKVADEDVIGMKS